MKGNPEVKEQVCNIEKRGSALRDDSLQEKCPCRNLKANCRLIIYESFPGLTVNIRRIRLKNVPSEKRNEDGFENVKPQKRKLKVRPLTLRLFKTDLNNVNLALGKQAVKNIHLGGSPFGKQKYESRKGHEDASQCSLHLFFII